MASLPDYYSLLGISASSEDVVVQAAYRALMRRYHPDKNPSSEAAARAQALNEAFSVLGDKARRAQYDRDRTHLGAGAGSPPPPSSRNPEASRGRDGNPPNGKSFRRTLVMLGVVAIAIAAVVTLINQEKWFGLEKLITASVTADPSRCFNGWGLSFQMRNLSEHTVARVDLKFNVRRQGQSIPVATVREDNRSVMLYASQQYGADFCTMPETNIKLESVRASFPNELEYEIEILSATAA